MHRSDQQHRVLNLWRAATVQSVRRDGPDLTSRQMGLLLTVYLTAPPHTVRGLAQALNISKPAVTRALDRLCTLGFLRRKMDEEDRRSVLVQRTVKGSVFLSEFAGLILGAETGEPGDDTQHRDAPDRDAQDRDAQDRDAQDRDTGALAV